uniref:G-protein coupled receptors family 1 profile domain-containing protein n=1 Tax=Ciona savignyi TaxID=51511 RepID=H2Z282_CIOSA
MNPAQRFLHGVLYAIFVWGIPFIITWVLTLMTSYESMRMLRHMREARRKSVKSTKALNRVDRDIRRTVLIVLLLFTLTVLPVFIVIMRFMLEPDVGCASKAQSISYYVTTLFLVCGSFCNVIIYNVCNKEFREACLKFFVDILRPCCFESVTALFEHQTSASKRRADYWKSNASKRSSTARDTKQNGSRSLSASTAITDASRTKSEDGTYPSKVVSTVSTTTYHDENLKN